MSLRVATYPCKIAAARIRKIGDRTLAASQKEEAAVRRILTDIEKNGDAALLKYIQAFDTPKMTAQKLVVTPKEIEKAHKSVPPSFKKAMKQAVGQITAFHTLQKRTSFETSGSNGAYLAQVVRPVDCAGVYVPGGSGGETPLVSSVIMGVIPAKVAGVKEIVMATPSMKNGAVDAHLLVAANIAGVDAIYKMGSAWAIGALAFGTQMVPRVDVIVGPGNIYVALAKKWVAGRVGIDMVAGPSEILIVADKTANATYVAADMLGQAEHDPMAASMLLTDNLALAKNVRAEIDWQIQTLPRKEIAIQSLQQYGLIYVVPNLDIAIDIANEIAPEHLELMIKNPKKELKKVKHAGAVFLGNYTPEVMGDYIAGPNHVLPTAGTARFSSGLSVDHFMKKTNVIAYDETAFRKEASAVTEIACVEGMEAHARSVRVRLKK